MWYTISGIIIYICRDIYSILCKSHTVNMCSAFNIKNCTIPRSSKKWVCANIHLLYLPRTTRKWRFCLCTFNVFRFCLASPLPQSWTLRFTISSLQNWHAFYKYEIPLSQNFEICCKIHFLIAKGQCRSWTIWPQIIQQGLQISINR